MNPKSLLALVRELRTRPFSDEDFDVADAFFAAGSRIVTMRQNLGEDAWYKLQDDARRLYNLVFADAAEEYIEDGSAMSDFLSAAVVMGYNLALSQVAQKLKYPDGSDVAGELEYPDEPFPSPEEILRKNLAYERAAEDDSL